VLQSRAPRRALVPWFTAYTVAVAAWYLVLATETRADSSFLTPTKCILLAAGPVAFYAYTVATWRWPTRLTERFPRAMPVVLCAVVVLAIAAAFAHKPHHMARSLYACYVNMGTGEFWQGLSLGLLVLAILGLYVPAAPFKQVFVQGIPLYLGLLLLLAYGRSPYRRGWDDSAARMSIHVAPMIVFYFGMKFGPLLLARREARTEVPA
jgi:hypothetical protein